MKIFLKFAKDSFEIKNMLKRYIYLFILGLVVCGLAACDPATQSDDSAFPEDAFRSFYPTAKVEQWTRRGGYDVAEFKNGDNRADVWFFKSGWVMTVTDLPFSEVPERVLAALGRSEFGMWEQVRACRIERKGMETVFAVLVERNKVGYELIYAESGVIVRREDATGMPSMTDSRRFLPQFIPPAIMMKVHQVYPHAVAYDFEPDLAMSRVYLLDGDTARMMCFSMRNEWLYTVRDEQAASLPAGVAGSFSRYMPGWMVDAVRHVDSPAGAYYRIDADSMGVKRAVRLDNHGCIVNK